jgi:hypothetical protein
VGYHSDVEAAWEAPFSPRLDWACYDQADPLIVTISNRDLGADPGSSWVCAPLGEVEKTAKAIYYVARTMEYLEFLFP